MKNQVQIVRPQSSVKAFITTVLGKLTLGESLAGFRGAWRAGKALSILNPSVGTSSPSMLTGKAQVV
jgi:hypothetical protein